MARHDAARQASRYVSQLEEAMVPAGYKLKVPEEYSNLPQLQVRPSVISSVGEALGRVD